MFISMHLVDTAKVQITGYFLQMNRNRKISLRKKF